MRNLIPYYLRSSIKLKFVTCLILVVIADWLFFDHHIGWTSGLYTILLCVSYVIHTSSVSLSKSAQIILLLISGQVLALIESPNILSFLLIITGFSGLVFIQKPRIQHNAKVFAGFIWRCLLVFWLNIFADYNLFAKYQKKHKSKAGSIFSIANNWLIPIGLSIVFIMLFSSANPVIESWIDHIDLSYLLQSISVPRLLFWIVAITLCWSVIRPRQILRRIKTKVRKEKPRKQNALITPSSIIRALVLFNLIFFVQTVMDIAYLWGGASLPHGMTYAEYAHRGAYPLIFTALLAAAFVLIALRSGSDSEKSHAIKVMVYIWVGQNIMLVVSSIWRTMLYIEAYQLTGLRIATIIWMVLVIIGLALIIIRILKQQDNIWLINRNFILLIVTLYICSFVNFGGIIAEYNISHSKEATGTGKILDVYYLKRNIREEAIPALIELKREMEAKGKDTSRVERIVGEFIYCTSGCSNLKWPQYSKEIRFWRGWTFRKYRISKYLEREGY